ncbi:Pol polyprotein, partial [Schistosoma japonicum]
FISRSEENARGITPCDNGMLSHLSSLFDPLVDRTLRRYEVIMYIRSKVSNKVDLRFLFWKGQSSTYKDCYYSSFELSAASMAIKIYSGVREELFLFKTTFWTDSMTVIYYLRNESNRYSCFMVNTVALIREVTDKDQWRHVPSRLNPEWLSGPFFLKEPEDNWPNREEPTVYETSLEYVKYLKVMYGGGHYNSSNEGRLTIAELRSAETVIVKAKLWKAW